MLLQRGRLWLVECLSYGSWRWQIAPFVSDEVHMVSNRPGVQEKGLGRFFGDPCRTDGCRGRPGAARKREDLAGHFAVWGPAGHAVRTSSIQPLLEVGAAEHDSGRANRQIASNLRNPAF